MITALCRRILFVVFFWAMGTLIAQTPEMQQRLNEIKEASAENKGALAQYTWQEQNTITLKGEVKKQEVYQVRLGPDGKPQKTSLTPQNEQTQQVQGRRGRVKEHVVEHKKEEYKEYAQKIGALAHSYAQPDPQLLQEAFQKGNLTFGSAGTSNDLRIAITNYIKPNDSMTIVFARQEKKIQSVQILSYMDDPSDAVKISVQFGQLPDGTNHISTMNIDGVAKHLTVAIQNSNYQKL